MTAPTPPPIVPAEHTIVVAMRAPYLARLCESYLTQAGFPVVLCPAEVTAATVIATVHEHYPHLLIVDDDIEWMPGIHVAFRLHAETNFLNLPVFMILRQTNIKPSCMERDRYPDTVYISRPFRSEELLHRVHRTFQWVLSGDLPEFPEPIFCGLTVAYWQSLVRRLPPFALFDAVWKGDQKTVERLITEGVNVQGKDRWGSTALHFAVQQGNLSLARLLLQHGAEVDAPNNNGETPLWQAAEKGHLILVYLLLKRGADPNAANAQGETALQRARQQNWPRIEPLLRDHGAQEGRNRD